jgi:hypothetical protein
MKPKKGIRAEIIPGARHCLVEIDLYLAGRTMAKVKKERKEPREPASAAPYRRSQRLPRWLRAFPLWRTQTWNVLIGAFYVAVHICILVHDMNTPEVS